METAPAACPRCKQPLTPGGRFCGQCGSPASPLSPLSPLSPGSTTGGGGAAPPLPERYEVVKFLGRGGMGRVYLCRDTLLDVEVAVKVLPAELCHDEEALQQIAREARAAAKFRSCPGILSLYGIERHGETWYLLMEYAAGGSLHDRLKREGALPEEECRAVGAEVAEALAFAQDQGVLHRDIKPANILLDGKGRAKVADFGIAKVMSEASSRQSLVTVAGTPVYMAPEIILQQTVDGRADLYSLGCMLYELSTGRRPFEGSYPEVAMMKTMPGSRPPDPRAVRPELSEEFGAVVRRLLEPDPGYRYSRARDVVEALGGLPLRATGRLPPGDDSGGIPVPMARPLEPTLTGAPPAPGGPGTVRPPTATIRAATRAEGAGPEAAAAPPAAAPLAPAPSSRRGAVLAAGAVLLVAGGLSAALLLPGGEDAGRRGGSEVGSAPPSPPPPTVPGRAGGGAPPPSIPAEGAPAGNPPSAGGPSKGDPGRGPGPSGGVEVGAPEAGPPPAFAPEPAPGADPEAPPAPPPAPVPAGPPPGLFVRSDPPGARITVDGVEAGVAGEEGLRLPDPEPGRAVILKAWLADHRPAEERGVTWRPGERREVRLVLARLTGFLVLEGGPPGASVECRREGGEPIRHSLSEEGTLGPFPVPVGEYAVTVEREGFDRWEGRVTVAADRTARRSVALREKEGTLAVDSTPSGAEVFDGEILLGRTPLPPTPLPAGTHEIRLVHPDRDDLRLEAVVRGATPLDLGTLALPDLAVLDLAGLPGDVTARLGGEPAAGEVRHRAGTVEVVLSRPAHADQKVLVTLPPAGRARPEPGPWTPLPGRLDLSALPPDAEVRVDGAPVAREGKEAPVAPGKRRIALLRPGFLPVPEREIVVEPAGRVVIPAPEWVPEVVVEAALPGLPPPPPAVLEAQRALRLPRGFVRTAEGRIFSEKDGAEMVLVAEGEFTMGSPANEDERPVHRPFLSSFLVDRHEVTTGQYRRFCEATNREFPRQEGEGFRKHPVTMVDWNDAAAYAAWAGRRLPSEAEWEKAARGTDGREYPWGNADDPALRNGEGGGDGFPQTSPGGAFPGGASPCGALDMAGNVWEWVADGYDAKAYREHEARDPRGPKVATLRVFRGGSWSGSARFLRSPGRNRSNPAAKGNNMGFRCAASLP